MDRKIDEYDLNSLYNTLYLLYKNNVDIYTILNHFSLPRNAHYTCLERYDELLRDKSPKTKFIRNAVGAASRIWRARRDTATPSCGYNDRPVEVLFVSHFLGDTSMPDNFFGNLVSTGADPQANCILYLNHTWQSSSDFAKQVAEEAHAGKAPTRRLLVPRGLPLKEAWQALEGLIAAGRRLAEHAPSARLGAHLEANALDPQNIFSASLIYHARRLLAELKPKVLMLTWEGHAWERALIACTRKVSPETRVIAYHHGPLFPLTVAAALPTVPIADPDALMVTGQSIADHYANTPLWHDKPVAVVGSPRAGSAVEAPIVDGSTLLVLPEGVLNETVDLFGLALRAAAIDTSIKVILRAHPAVDRAQILQRLPELKTKNSRIFFSDRPFETDIASARWMLYRGSTTAFEGLRKGLRPLLFSDDQHPYAVDALHDPGPWQCKISDPKDIVAACDSDRGIDESIRNSYFRSAIKHVQGLIQPLNKNAADDFIKRVQQQPRTKK